LLNSYSFSEPADRQGQFMKGAGIPIRNRDFFGACRKRDRGRRGGLARPAAPEREGGGQRGEPSERRKLLGLPASEANR